MPSRCGLENRVRGLRVVRPPLIGARRRINARPRWENRHGYDQSAVGVLQAAKDPIFHAGGLNLYQYCGNDPVNYSDKIGLEPNYPHTFSSFNSPGAYARTAGLFSRTTTFFAAYNDLHPYAKQAIEIHEGFHQNEPFFNGRSLFTPFDEVGAYLTEINFIVNKLGSISDDDPGRADLAMLLKIALREYSDRTGTCPLIRKTK